MQDDMVQVIYRYFQDRDIDGLLSLMCEDVNWSSGLTGDRLKGKKELRSYFTLLWTSLDSQGEILQVYEEDGKTVVKLRQLIKEKNGRLLTDLTFEQVYTLRDGLIERMDFRHPR